MSFVWKADKRRLSEEEIARRVHGVALARSLDDLATVMTLMCYKVEADFWCPWNRADPSSEKYDHDSESDDGRSVGYAQQQNGRPGEELPPGDRDNWWGPMSSRMSETGAADVFMDRLPDDYTRAADNPRLAGEMVANVQQCAPRFRYRYAEEWDYCWDLLRRAQAQGPIAPVPPPAPVPVPITVMRPSFTELQMFGRGANQRTRKPINFFIHTQEGSWDATARDLAEFCQGQNGVSYHYTVRDGIVYDVVDTDLYCWAVLDANVFSVNLCFAGSSITQTREQWLQRYGFDIEIAAYLAVQDARKYGFSTQVHVPDWAQRGGEIYPGQPGPGISDHNYVTRELGIGDHTDVGPNFPWDVFKGHVDRYAQGGDVLSDPTVVQMIKDIHEAVFEDGGIPSDSPYAPVPPPRFRLKDLVKFTDASSHARSVESGALMGNIADLQLMYDAAQRGVERAVNAWHDVPNELKDKLANYPGDHAKG